MWEKKVKVIRKKEHVHQGEKEREYDKVQKRKKSNIRKKKKEKEIKQIQKERKRKCYTKDIYNNYEK